MKKESLLLIAIGALFIGGIMWALTDENKRLRNQIYKEEEKDKIKKDYLNLLKDYLTKNKSLPESVKAQLLDLKEHYVGIQDDIAIELNNIVELIRMGKEELAVATLTKIVENLLKDRYVEEHIVETRDKCPNFHQMLEHAKKSSWISERSFHFSMILKNERNMSFHELNPILNENERLIGFLAGIEMIYNLKGLKKSL